MEVPTPDPSKLLQSWMEWERGEVTPGRVMANMKTGGMRVLLEELVAGGPSEPSPSETSPSETGSPAPSPSETSPSETSQSKPDDAPA